MNGEGVHFHKGGTTTFSGLDAVHLFRAAVLKSGLGLLSKGIRPTQGLSLTKALKMASGYTGKKYKRGEAERARADLQIWIDTMKAALPVETEEFRLTGPIASYEDDRR